MLLHIASVKIVLRQKPNKDGTLPLAIRITKDRKTSFVHLGYHLKETDWDSVQQRVKKSHANSTRLNNYLVTKLAEASGQALELETQKTDVSSRAVKQKLRPRGSNTFFGQAAIYLHDLKEAGKYNQWQPDTSRLKTFRAFLRGEDIAFSDVTVPLLERFQHHLKRTTDLGQRSIINHLVVIRSVYSHAIGSGTVDKKHYPFGRGQIQIKFPGTKKLGLSNEEVLALEALNLPDGSVQRHALNVWLFSFYFAGVRISDVLRIEWKDFQNNRLHYTMGENDKGGSLKLSDKVVAILTEYEGQKD